MSGATSCKLCTNDPTTHTFIPFGKVGDASLYYTNPSKSKEVINTEERFVYFRSHLDDAKKGGKWIWVFDCAGMRSEHYMSFDIMKKLMKELSEDQLNSLIGIWVIHPNTWMRASVAFIRPFFKSELMNRIKMINGKQYVLIDKLQKAGLVGKPLDWLNKESVLSKLAESYVPDQGSDLLPDELPQVNPHYERDHVAPHVAKAKAEAEKKKIAF